MDMSVLRVKRCEAHSLSQAPLNGAVMSMWPPRRHGSFARAQQAWRSEAGSLLCLWCWVLGRDDGKDPPGLQGR